MLTQVSPPFSKETVVGVGVCIYIFFPFCIYCFEEFYVTAGYAFLLFREEVSVHRLVKSCLTEEGKLYMFVSSLTQNNKKVSHPHIHHVP